MADGFATCCSGSALLEPNSQRSWVNPDRAERADHREPPAPGRFIECLLVVSKDSGSFPDGHVPGGPVGKFFQYRFHH